VIPQETVRKATEAQRSVGDKAEWMEMPTASTVITGARDAVITPIQAASLEMMISVHFTPASACRRKAPPSLPNRFTELPKSHR